MKSGRASPALHSGGPEAVVPLMERFLKAAAGLAGSHVLLGFCQQCCEVSVPI